MKFAILADTHAGVRLDDPVFDDSARRFFTEQFFPYLQTHEITNILHVGDMFDRRKNINFQSLQSFREYFLSPIVAADLLVIAIPGNHDIYHKNTLSPNALELLLAQYSENIQVVYRAGEQEWDGNKYALVPWICEENEKEITKFLKTTKAKVVFGHFEIDGFEMYKGVAHQGGMGSDVFKRFDAVYSGHFHHKNSNGNIHYLGCPYEMTWSDYDDPKGFHVFDTDTDTMEFVLNPNTMHVKIYYDDEQGLPNPQDFARKFVKLIVVKKTDFKKYDNFVDGLQETVSDLKIWEDVSAFETDSVDDTVVVDDTATLLDRYVDDADADETVDKDRLKLVLKSLHIEAQHMEV